MSEFTFEQLKEKVLDFVMRKKLVKPLEEIDSLVKSKFLLLLGMPHVEKEKAYTDIKSESVLVFPEKLAEEYEQMKAFKNRLDELFEEFIKGKNVKEKTKRKYEDMYFLLSRYVSQKGYTSMKWIKKLNVDTWMKWARREWGISRYKEDECRSAVKQFLKFLKNRERQLNGNR